MPVLQVQPYVLAQVLDGLTGADQVNSEVLSWLSRDPGLLAHLLEDKMPNRRDAGLEILLSELDCSDLKLWAANASTKALGLGPLYKLRDWTTSLGCAYLCLELAGQLGYHAEAAYLAGLFHNLDSFEDGRQVFQPRQRGNFAQVAEWIEAWGIWPNVADAIGAQVESGERLRDALPLAKLLRVARALASGDGDAYRLAAVLLPELSPDALESARREAESRMLDLRQKLGFPSGNGAVQEDGRLVREHLVAALDSYFLIEKAAGTIAPGAGEAETLDAAIDYLSRYVGLREALYLSYDRESDCLLVQSANDGAYGGLRIPVKDSNSAAAWAMTSRMPVLFSTRDPDSVSMLDVHLARQSGYGTVMAMPIGDFQIEGVIVGCVSQRQAAIWESDIGFLSKLGRFIGRQMRQAREPRAGSAASVPVPQDVLRGKVRRAVHEVSNPLGIAKNYLAILGGKLGENNPGAEELRIIREELDRIPKVLKTLAAEEGETARAEDSIHIEALVRAMSVIAESAVPEGKRVDVVARVEPGLPNLRNDAEKLKQLLVNLILNAVDAVPDGGQVALDAAASVNHAGERHVVITVRDNGPGIPAERMKQLFEPAESGKGGQHAGLGLSIVKSLALDLGVEITCQSGRTGTTFSVVCGTT